MIKSFMIKDRSNPKNEIMEVHDYEEVDNEVERI